MQKCFITSQTDALPSWYEAFGDALTLSCLPLPETLSANVLYWLDWHSLSDEQAESTLALLLAGAQKVVVMTSHPDAQRGMQFFSIGVRGYCHRFAVASQLCEVAKVIELGGVWLGSEAMQRLMQGTLRVAAAVDKKGDAEVLLAQLTPKERLVALEVAHGASNREISVTLSVSERTVKAHLSAIFDKLAVRDRVQLALILNNIDLR
ncbi:LuxR C-terminal-related transcriptional regulator [Spongiibacter sp.]|uniref:response regulator transcription factor n=1 Tax=Spongiibacter sp. TaxID=2024860 RepID=UPI00356B262E